MNNVKRNLLITNLFLLVVVFLWMRYDKEELLKEGEVLVLKLAPADPRSFMMGDYMTLNYEVNDKLPNQFDFGSLGFQNDGPNRRGVVLKMEDSLAVFVRMDSKQPLEKGEFKLPCVRRYFRWEILPNEYLFQEGQGKHFDRAEYAQFRVDKSGDVVIEYLLDKDRKPLK
ncbi:MAG: hypothetical protein K0S23_3162 [Fluviicola sp.]|jgi:uncharacterized membrane-anchored protein|uniref:GDYXXLXY domain-containing protein n=1 Tax=Fluviicola sp. TaxID=1917219 RepID=UPI00260CF46A|nr:GDYXXLXY domain-containing protein [Fluviicola sp.]MDF3028855.1 hypothetical protein [Fluviicola sp.]